MGKVPFSIYNTPRQCLLCKTSRKAAGQPEMYADYICYNGSWRVKSFKHAGFCKECWRIGRTYDDEAAKSTRLNKRQKKQGGGVCSRISWTRSTELNMLI